MRALIVHDSTAPGGCPVTTAIAAALSARGATVDTVPAGSAPPAFADRVDLLVVAAPVSPLPTQPAAAFIPTVGLPGPGGVREWMERVDLPPGQPTATFDLRPATGLPGSPARAAARRLRERGATIVGTRSFCGPAPGGRLGDAERGRVRDWAAGLVVEAAIHRVG